MKRISKLTFTAALLALLAAPLTAQEFKPESTADYDARMQWFTDAKFGLFIHYGVYSNLGGEWKGKPVPKYAEWIQRWGKITPEEYIPLAADFRPDQLDADLWVKTAKEAGMKYMVITTKHHEGFCLWDSAHTEYDLGEATTFNRDILGELKAACDKYDLKFGTYYSIIDWHHPTQRAQAASNQPPLSDKAEYVKYMKAQLKELIERYDPAVMWFDGDWVKWWTMEDGADLYNYLRELSPNMIINNRVAKRKSFKKDFGTPENSTPGAALDHRWEACWTINHSWGFKKSDTKWKESKVLVQKLIDINTKGGNLLLNVGPQANGAWPDASLKQFAEMGAWTSAHEDAFRNAEFVAIKPPAWGRIAQAKGSTADQGSLFAYVFDWPANGKLQLSGAKFGQVQATTYDGTKLPATVSAKGVEIDLSSAQPSDFATVLRIHYKDGLKLASNTGGLDLNGDELVLQAGAAKLSGSAIQLKNGTLVNWTKPGDTATWELNVPAPGKYTVKVLYTCSKKYAGSDIKLSVGSQSVNAQVKPTGKKKPVLLELGEMNLNQVGATECTVGFGDKKGKALMDLKTILFVPIN